MHQYKTGHVIVPCDRRYKLEEIQSNKFWLKNECLFVNQAFSVEYFCCSKIVFVSSIFKIDLNIVDFKKCGIIDIYEGGCLGFSEKDEDGFYIPFMASNYITFPKEADTPTTSAQHLVIYFKEKQKDFKDTNLVYGLDFDPNYPLIDNTKYK